MQVATVYDDQLLATKFFMPASSHALISRPRLNALLEQGLHYKLTLLSAPAGFGKTTLLSAWLHTNVSTKPPVAWVSLDESDNDPVHFWTYVLTALDACQPGLCTQLLAFLLSQQAPPLKSILTALINGSLEHAEPLLLVLDDYHVITEQAVHDTLEYLLEHLPSHLHVIFSTRTDPPLPLSRLRVHDQILEIRTDQLRCTAQEGVAFLRVVMGTELSSSALQRIVAHTEGWLAGLQLLGLSLQGRRDPSAVLKELRGDQRYILDYLTEEVLRRQPPEVQAFLLRTAILDRLSASLCDAVMEQVGSQKMLEYLERANLFVVSLDTERHWYRYHTLFAEALHYRLEQSQGALVATLHRRASEWFDKQEHFNEAVQHAVQASDWERAADLIERVAIVLSYRSSEPVPLLRWLKQLPPEVVRPRPYLCLIYAQMMFLVAPPMTVEAQQRAGVLLHEAQIALEASLACQETDGGVTIAQERRDQEDLLASILALRALIAGYHGDPGIAFSLCQQALTHLSEHNLAIQAVVAIAKALAHVALGEADPAVQKALEASSLGQASGSIWQAISHKVDAAICIKFQGNLHETWRLGQQAIELAQEPARGAGGLLPPNISMAYGLQADVLREWNQLEAAQDLVLQGIELAEQAALLSALDQNYAVLGSILMAQGKMDEAATAITRAERVDEQLHNPYIQTLLVLRDQVRLWLLRGDVERGSQWAEDLLSKERQTSPFGQEREDVAVARILLAQQKPQDALLRLTSLLERASKQERWEHVIEMLLLQALAYRMCKQEQEALKALSQAVDLAEPQGYIRRFVDEGPPMAVLLSRLRAQQRKQGPTPYLDTVLAAFSSDAVMYEPGNALPDPVSHPSGKTGKGLSLLLLDPLSERELEVLRLLARGASNQEIADELVVALNTVKHHISNILSKLGVGNRTHAVAQARGLGLLLDDP